MHSLFLVLVTAVVTAFACIVSVNLTSVERRLQRRPRGLYALHDADFRRALRMGADIICCKDPGQAKAVVAEVGL